MKRVLYSLIFLLCLSVETEAQQITAEATLDSVTIFIGGRVGLNVEVRYPENIEAHYLPFEGDTIIAEVEIAERMNPDTLKEGGMVRIMQRYLVQSFDSGLHYMAPVPVLRLPDGSVVDCDIPALNVINPFQQMDVDEQSGVARIFDVWDAKDAPFDLAEMLTYWPYGVILLFFVALCAGGFYLYKRRRRGERVDTWEGKVPKEAADVVALRELEHLKEQKLWQKGNVKEYYSIMTDTLRRYISERYAVNALESTTDETMTCLRSIPSVDMADTQRLQSVLETADFAKFAKFEPLPDVNDTAMKQAMEFVKSTSNVMPDAHNDAVDDR